MKRYFCLIAAMLAAAATPALAAVQRTADHQVMGEQVRQGRARLREELEARKRDAKQRPRAVQHEANSLCTACPDKGAKAHHHSVSNDRKPDCPECISQAIDA